MDEILTDLDPFIDIQLFRERLSEKLCTQQSRRVMEYDQYTVPDIVAIENTFAAFP